MQDSSSIMKARATRRVRRDAGRQTNRNTEAQEWRLRLLCKKPHNEVLDAEAAAQSRAYRKGKLLRRFHTKDATARPCFRYVPATSPGILHKTLAAALNFWGVS